MKKYLLIAALAGLSLVACSGSKGSTEATAKAGEAGAEQGSNAESGKATEAAKSGDSNGTLIMATNAEFPPYEYYEGKEIVGIDVEIAQAIAEEMGMKLEISDLAFDAIIPAIQSGKADFGAAGMTVSEDRLKNVDFSDSYATSVQSVIVAEDSIITSIDDLKGKKVGVQQGTTGDLYSSDDLGEDSVERFPKGADAVQALQAGKVDAVIIDKNPAEVFVSQNKGLKLLDSAYAEEEYAICVKKGNTELVGKINTALKNLKDSGKLEEITAKYIQAK